MIKVVLIGPPLPTDVNQALEAISSGARPTDHESEILDFKSQGRSRDDAMRNVASAAVCFANARGGSVVLGVSDRAYGPAAFEGTDLEPADLTRRVFELTDPHLNVSVVVTKTHDRRLLVVTVPPGPDVFQIDGRATERIGASCERMSATRIATVVAERRGEDWSARDTGIVPTAVDPVALAQARTLLRQSTDPTRRAHSDASDPDLLRRLGVVSPNGTLLEAGRLLFMRSGDAGHALAYQFRRTASGTLVVNERFGAPMLTSVIRSLEFVDARLDTTPLNLPGGQQVQLADLPSAAIREAVVNAVAHRDYRQPGVIRVEQSPTRIRVTSPGPLVTGVTPTNILVATRARNPVLAGVIRTVGLAEQAGVGVDRMYVEMTRLGHEPPTFASEADEVTVVLLGGAPNTYMARFIATLPDDDANDADTLLVIFTLLHSRKVTASSLAPSLQKSPPEIENVLRRLASPPLALIEPTRQSARRSQPEYRLQETAVAALGSAVTYRRRTQDEIDRKVIGIVREAGQVNARMVKLVLDLEPVPASRVLADLVARGILVKTSQAQRGRSVTYGPGAAFPAPATRRTRRRTRPQDKP
jgi:ATP-dependent DNA helicase RecG